MKLIKLTFTADGSDLYLLINGNLAFYRDDNQKVTYIQDGGSDSRGWVVKETPEEIIEKLKNAQVY